MASSRPWPFDDEDRPSGSVRPLSQADLQAILAHLSDDPEELLAGPCPGGSPSSSGSAPVGKSLAACWRPDWD
jgi:hypothetical protein